MALIDVRARNAKRDIGDSIIAMLASAERLLSAFIL
jgi:hypothetical protein